jgi:uncharacterized protein YukE
MVAIVIGLILVSFAAPVFAQDPPDTQVTVGVVTSGDVDLDVDINAGGDVDVTVDGVDLDATARMARIAYTNAKRNEGKGFVTYSEWYKYFYKEMKAYNQVLANMDSVLGVLADAEAKLMQGQDLTKSEIGAINEALVGLKLEVGGSLADINFAISDIKAQEEKTWNQLMYGAEAHIAILDTQLAEQQQVLTNLQADTKAELDVANLNYVNLLNYTDYLQRQYLYYFWICGSGMVVLLGIVVGALLRKRS